jgi:hypothetical protein
MLTLPPHPPITRVALQVLRKLKSDLQQFDVAATGSGLCCDVNH